MGPTHAHARKDTRSASQCAHLAAGTVVGLDNVRSVVFASFLHVGFLLEGFVIHRHYPDKVCVGGCPLGECVLMHVCACVCGVNGCIWTCL
jgi:hypothetical protein